jgi:5-formaminoimidazole-4-carboxamide-1-beta-D-ribofuranosyl 5'-monophosphate synthetase
MTEKIFIKERETFLIPFPHLGVMLGIEYNVSDFHVRNYGTRKILNYETIFYN